MLSLNWRFLSLTFYDFYECFRLWIMGTGLGLVLNWISFVFSDCVGIMSFLSL